MKKTVAETTLPAASRAVAMVFKSSAGATHTS